MPVIECGLSRRRTALTFVGLLLFWGTAHSQCPEGFRRVMDGGSLPVLGENHVSFVQGGFFGFSALYVADIATGSRVLVADTDTAMPGVEEQVFTEFQTHSLSDDTLAFIGRGTRSSPSDEYFTGIYLFDIPSKSLSKLVDMNDIAPASDPEAFANNYAAMRDLHFNEGELVFSTNFNSRGPSGRSGVYWWDGDEIQVVADHLTVIPADEDLGGATQTFRSFGNVATNGSAAAFTVGANSSDGFSPEGIYTKNIDPLTSDLPTLVRDSRISGIGDPPYRFFSVSDFDGPTLGFRASFDEAESLIGGFYTYSIDSGGVTEVTRQTDSIPDGPDGLTWSFGVFIDNRFSVGGSVGFFSGGGANEDFTVSHSGLYRFQESKVEPFLHRGDSLDGGTLWDARITRFSFKGGRLAFHASFSDGRPSGIFITDSSPGIDPSLDTDGDGIPDVWEICGLPGLDLPAMGADPMRKNIFVHVDYMVQPLSRSGGELVLGHSHEPKPRALAAVRAMFASAPVENPDGSTGIDIHIDAGPDSVMNPRTGELWGDLSRSNRLRERATIGRRIDQTPPRYDWREFDRYKERFFPSERENVFHYSLFGHTLGGLGTTSGVSRGIPASDFLVTLGGFPTVGGTAKQQAGTFVHELGHNLGLRHGGEDNRKFKPNYISCMNYLFQNRGIIQGGRSSTIDFSRWGADEIPDLNEASLIEGVGLNGPESLAGYGTRFFCCASGACNLRNVANANGVIDWNCNGVQDNSGVQADINRSGAIEIHGTRNDWTSLTFDGGSIGASTTKGPIPLETEVDELTFDMELEMGPEEYALAVFGPGPVQLAPGMSLEIPFHIENVGTTGDTYMLSAQSVMGWADLGVLKGSHIAPKLTALGPGEKRKVTVTLNVPEDSAVGMTDRVVLTAVSGTDPDLLDQSVVEIEVNETGPPAFETPDSEDLFRFQQYWTEPEHRPGNLLNLLGGG